MAENRPETTDGQTPATGGDSPSNFDGEPRRLGIELEMSASGTRELSGLVAQALGGSVTDPGIYRAEVDCGEDGIYGVELDVDLLRRSGGRPPVDDEFARWIVEAAEELLAGLAATVAPLEIVGPPLPEARALQCMDRITDHLQAAGIEGTRAAPHYAFGVHFNPEPRQLDPEAIRRHILAFGLLDPWLRRALDVVISRRLVPFIEAYPPAYIEALVRAGPPADRAELAELYLAHNPTRNRALDMLPLLAWHDEDRVRSRVPDPKVKPRPTFHYRLPNSRVGETGWLVSHEWWSWQLVETLASHEALDELAGRFLSFRADAFERFAGDWARQVEGILGRDGLIPEGRSGA